jgi:hypothetical protein
MEIQLDELVVHENVTICTHFAHMDANFNYIADPCENIPKNY